MASLLELDARQRMINMMYIIFIAMMALNMSKEVLTAFGDVNSSLMSNIDQSGERNTALMAGLASKAEEQPEKYRPLHDKALEMESVSNELVDYIQNLKEELQERVRKDEDGNMDYESMDTDVEINEKFFANNRLTDEAKELKDKIRSFKNKAQELAEAADNAEMANYINLRFSTDTINVKDGGKEDWMKYHFEGFPLIAGVTKLTNIQADAKQVQSNLLSSLVSGQMESDVSMTNYQAIVVPDKTAFFSGENFKGKVVLGRFDNTLNFNKVTINGDDIKDLDAGQVNLDFPAGNVGEQDIKGELQFKEGDSIVRIPVSSSYSVIPKPNSAVISADKMNVVYRGVKNPLTISIPGVSSITANAPGMSQVSGAKYELDPTTVKGREVKINVSGKLANGETVSDSKSFRIKDIPNPVGTVRGEDGLSGPIKMQRNDLKISSVGAVLPDFDFDLSLAISGFKLQVPGKPIVEVNGQKLNDAAQRAVDDAQRGSTIQIFDIRANIAGNSSYHLPRVAPITVQLTN